MRHIEILRQASERIFPALQRRPEFEGRAVREARQAKAPQVVARGVARDERRHDAARAGEISELINKTVKEQAPMLELAEAIIERTPVQQVRLVNSGTEATMSVLRLALEQQLHLVALEQRTAGGHQRTGAGHSVRRRLVLLV